MSVKPWFKAWDVEMRVAQGFERDRSLGFVDVPSWDLQHFWVDDGVDVHVFPKTSPAYDKIAHSLSYLERHAVWSELPSGLVECYLVGNKATFDLSDLIDELTLEFDLESGQARPTRNWTIDSLKAGNKDRSIGDKCVKCDGMLESLFGGKKAWCRRCENELENKANPRVPTK